MRISLYKRLKPEFKQQLLDNIEEYPSITTDLIKALSSQTYWQDLTMGNCTSLISFTSHKFSEMSDCDWITGEVLFIEQKED